MILDNTGSFTLALVASSVIAFMASLVYFFMVNKPIVDPAAASCS